MINVEINVMINICLPYRTLIYFWRKKDIKIIPFMHIRHFLSINHILRLFTAKNIKPHNSITYSDMIMFNKKKYENHYAFNLIINSENFGISFCLSLLNSFLFCPFSVTYYAGNKLINSSNSAFNLSIINNLKFIW